MNVCLVPDIPDDFVERSAVNMMQSDGQLYNTKA